MNNEILTDDEISGMDDHKLGLQYIVLGCRSHAKRQLKSPKSEIGRVFDEIQRRKLAAKDMIHDPSDKTSESPNKP